jgi:hypothetical protein
MMCRFIPLQASTKDLSATMESTLTGSSGSLNAATILCMAALKFLWSEKLIVAYWPETHAA